MKEDEKEGKMWKIERTNDWKNERLVEARKKGGKLLSLWTRASVVPGNKKRRRGIISNNSPLVNDKFPETANDSIVFTLTLRLSA